MNKSNSYGSYGDIVVDIKEFFWRMLEQWKAVVIFAVIIAIIFSGLMYFRASGSTTEPAAIKTSEEVFNELSPEDQKAISAVLKEKKYKDITQNYINNSILMSIDPYNAKVLCMTWLVNSEEGINKQLVDSYATELRSNSAIDAIGNVWNGKYEVDQIRELINTNVTIPPESEAGQEANILKFVLYIPLDEEIAATDEVIKQFISGISEKLTSGIGDHTITLLNCEYRVANDDALSTLQYNVYNKFYNISTQVYNMRDKLTTGQKAAYDKILTYKESEGQIIPNEETPAEEKPKISFFNKKRLAIGFILGGIMYVGLYLLIFIFSSRVRSPKAIEMTYGIGTLGEWHTSVSKNIKSFLFKDSLVYGLHHKGHLDLNTEVNRLSEFIFNNLDTEENKELIIANDFTQDDSSGAFKELLKARLSERGIYVAESKVDMNNGAYLSDDCLRTGNAVLLLIKKSKTIIKNIEEVYDKCLHYGKPLLGAAYIE